MSADVPSIPISSLAQPFHVGSVQRLHEVPGRPGWMVSETTRAGSVFDVGSIFEIDGSDVARALFRHVLFNRLADPASWREVRAELEGETGDSVVAGLLLQGPLEGLQRGGAATHHIGMLDGATGELVTGAVPDTPSRFNVVRRFRVHHPKRHRVLGGSVFDYSWFTTADGYVIPLEYLVRFGITTGSSVWQRYQKAAAGQRQALLQEWGVTGDFAPWQTLREALVDCSSKYEPEDRAVSRQEAMMMSGLSAGQFADSLKLALLGGRMVRRMVAGIGLTLWDLKWELACEDGQLVFVDTVDTDSIRATLSLEVDGRPVAVHVNKQAMRDYYRICHGDWLEGVEQAKREAAAGGLAFSEVLSAGVERGRFPRVPEVEEAFRRIQGGKMSALVDWLCGRSAPSEVRSRLEHCGQQEAEYFRGCGRLAEWLDLTATDTATTEGTRSAGREPVAAS